MFLRRQTLLSLVAWETYVTETKKWFCLRVRNIFASQTQILFPKPMCHVFRSLATMKTILTTFPVMLIKNITQQWRAYNNG